MSYRSENTDEDLGPLTGATIEKIDFADWDDGMDFVQGGVVRMRVRYAEGWQVNGATHGEYEIWQDPEGNGPGFLAFVQSG